MKWVNSARVSLALSATALFVALGGTAVAVSQIGTSQIRNGAVTATKVKNGAITNPKLANGSVSGAKLGKGSVTNAKLGADAVANGNLANSAVTSAKVQDGSLTSSDVAPDTFLAASGTAVNSQQLGGLTPAGFIRGTGRWVSNRVVVPAGGTAPILELNFAFIRGTCPGLVPTQSIVAELPLENALYTAINFGNSSTAGAGTTDVSSANVVNAGSALVATHASTAPQTVTWQAAYNDGKDEIATAWVSGQDTAGSCLFIAQGASTLG